MYILSFYIKSISTEDRTTVSLDRPYIIASLTYTTPESTRYISWLSWLASKPTLVMNMVVMRRERSIPSPSFLPFQPFLF